MVRERKRLKKYKYLKKSMLKTIIRKLKKTKKP